MSTCAHCSAHFTPPPRGRPPRYCREDCRRAAQAARRGSAPPSPRFMSRPGSHACAARARPSNHARAGLTPTPGGIPAALPARRTVRAFLELCTGLGNVGDGDGLWGESGTATKVGGQECALRERYRAQHHECARVRAREGSGVRAHPPSLARRPHRDRLAEGGGGTLVARPRVRLDNRHTAFAAQSRGMTCNTGMASPTPRPSPGRKTASCRHTGPPVANSPGDPAGLRPILIPPDARPVSAEAGHATPVVGLVRCPTPRQGAIRRGGVTNGGLLRELVAFSDWFLQEPVDCSAA